MPSVVFIHIFWKMYTHRNSVVSLFPCAAVPFSFTQCSNYQIVVCYVQSNKSTCLYLLLTMTTVQILTIVCETNLWATGEV